MQMHKYFGMSENTSALKPRIFDGHQGQNYTCASISPRLGGHTVANQPPTTVLRSFTFILSPPPQRCIRSHSRCGTVMNWTWTCVSPSWLDYRVPTTPCTSRLKTKKTKNSFNLSRKYCMDKSSWYYSRNIGGTFVIMSPQSKYWGGDVSPLSHRDRRPWNYII